MNKAAEELGSDTVGKAKNLQNLVQKKKEDKTSYFIVFLWARQYPWFFRSLFSQIGIAAGGFNFSFKCGVWMKCYMASGDSSEDMGGFSR